MTVVDEDWVRQRISMLSGGEKRSDLIPPQSFVPLTSYVDELLSTDENEGQLEYEGGKK